MQRSSINTVVVNGRLGEKWEARVSKDQHARILKCSKNHGLGPDDLGPYVASGDITYLDDATHAKLRAIVKACQEDAPSASAARRYWPRKVASVLLHG